MLALVVLIPAAAGAMALAIPGRAWRRALLPVGALGHSAAVAWLLAVPPAAPEAHAWIALDAAGRIVLAVTSALFLASAAYSVGYLRREADHATRDAEEGFLFRNEPEAIFIACMLLFLATMSLVCISRHLGLLWIAVEATTLVSAPLIAFHRHHRSLEATWKYLLICSVGIALALLGNFFLAYAGRPHVQHLPAGGHGLGMGDLLDGAKAMNPTWLKAAFLLLLVGYGTKMGLAPLHAWLPDAHSEAPSMVSALLSGALLNCAFLGILRGHTVLSAAGLGSFSGELLVLFGLLSMAVAALFIIRQGDFKRLLAYSSVEHVGILAFGVGLGGLAGTGAMLHAANHSLAKGLLFLTAGNLLAAYRTKHAADVRGALKATPVSGALWLAGFLAIAGCPPFGLFLSELTILQGAIEAGRWPLAAGYLLLLGVVFVAMARIVLPMAFGLPGAAAGPPQETAPARRREPAWSVLPPLALGAGVLALGFYIPPPLWNLLREAASVTGTP
jgi:hydrogenase-4 component F